MVPIRSPYDNKAAAQAVATLSTDWTFKDSEFWIVCDEVDKFIGKGSRKSPMLDAVSYGRNNGVGFIAACRRTAALSDVILAGADYGFFFTFNDLGTERRLKTLGFDVEKIKSLKEHEYFFWRADDPTVLQGAYKA